MKPEPNTFPQWEPGLECAEQVAACMMESARQLGLAIAWMTENACFCEQAKANPSIVDALTGDEATGVMSAMREFAMTLDRAALVKSMERGQA